MAYEFHYTPTGTGVISGKEVLEQTEDAINDLGNTAISGVQEALDKAEQALTNSQNAVDDAQTALNTANNAEGVAIQAQTDVGNLSGTVTNIGNRVTTAEGNITNLQGRMTTAEGNVTNLQGRMTTAETNIGNLQTAVSTAQATANSAQQTATTARQQSYVFRYSSTALTPSSTNSNALLDNTDNLKVGDKVIDSSGVLFSITAIDTANSTFTIGTALIDLALDANVVHTSGNEAISGDKVFNNRLIKNIDVVLGTAPSTGKFSNIDIADNNKSSLLQVLGGVYDTGNSYARFFVQNKTADDGTGLSPTGTLRTCGFNINLPASSTSEGQGSITPRANKTTDFGLLSYQWRNLWCEKLFLNGTQLDPSAFVTTDTNQTISGGKTFSDNLTIYDSDNTQTPKGLTIRNAQWVMGESGGVTTSIINFLDKNSSIPASIIASKGLYGQSFLRFSVRTKDSQNNTLAEEIYYDIDTSGNVELRSWHDNTTRLGTSAYKWKDCQTNLINGINPGGLSLPSSNLNDVIDISSYLVYLDGTANTYTAPANGWIAITMSGCSGIQAYINGLWGNQIVRPSAGAVRFLMPVVKNLTANILIFNGTIDNARFIPCQGNV